VAIPTRLEADRLLVSFDLPSGIVVHSRGVSRVAAAAARLLRASGVEVDADLVEVAALLHDIDKPETRRSGEPHGVVGARRLTELGYAELAGPVASHPVSCLLDAQRFPRGWPAILVAVADRRVDQRFVTIDERIDGMAQRYPQYREQLEAARGPAHALEASLAAAAGLSDEELAEKLRAAWEQQEEAAT
jgi:putative nucleotidyltransferase with HDIG domain